VVITSTISSLMAWLFGFRRRLRRFAQAAFPDQLNVFHSDLYKQSRDSAQS